MKNDRICECKFILSILSDLKTNYSHIHNVEEIDYLLSILKYRLHQLETAQVAKYKSNEERHSESFN